MIKTQKFSSAKKVPVTKLSIQSILIGILLLLIVGLSCIGLLQKKDHDQQQLFVAEVVRILDLQSDGGFFYQLVEAKIINPDKLINIKIPIKDLNIEQVNQGDRVYIRQIDSAAGLLYSFDSYKRGGEITWILMAFVSLMFIMLGKQGLKYILPSVALSILIFSGAFNTVVNFLGIYAGALVIIAILVFLANLMHINELKFAITVSIAQLVTLVLILLLNLILFRITFMTEIFYSQAQFIVSEVSLFDFWAVINTAVLFVCFGATSNTVLDVVLSVISIKKVRPSIGVVNLIREGVSQNQLASARIINSLGFFFSGAILIFIVFNSQISSGAFFWDNPNVMQAIILFINGALSSMLVGPVAAIFTALMLTNEKNEIQFHLK